MIPKECKRLAEVDFPIAEVDFPIAEVSRHAAREKSIRHGHPSTLHPWWARRPLASCRAVLLGLLWPDPCDPLCPAEFKEEARRLLPTVGGCNPGKTDEDLRRALLRFIANFASWDVSADRTYLEVARALVKAAYPEEPPLVVDPFAGGGSIPLEALRVGCEAFASDLNPVACLILKVLLEDIPRHGPKLAEEIRRVGAEIKKQAEQELADLYPEDPDGATPIAYLWARTVRCEAPNCGAEIPLVRSFWLCKKPNRKRALRYRIDRPNGRPPEISFEIFEPRGEKEVPAGTVTRARATCPACGAVLPPERVRVQLSARRGGADVVFDEHGRRIGGARLLAVVTLKPGEQGRHYRLPTERDYEAVRKAQARLARILEEWERGGRKELCPVPDEPLPPIGTLGFRVQRYGMLQWGDLFTARQKVALVTLVGFVRALPAAPSESAGGAGRPASYGGALRELVMCAFDVFARSCNGNARLRPDSSVAPAFGMHALPITWTFPETILSGGRSEHFDGALETVARVIELGAMNVVHPGQVQLADAAEHPLPDETAHIWFTDPPYYDAVPYADLSDFFFVWLKRALPGHPILRDPFDPENPLTPKTREAVQNERSQTEDGRPKDRAFYEETMARAFAKGRRILREDGIGSIVFAHKTTEGWEALLSGLIRGGWTITASWPIATEMASRLRARESAALATSVHLVCRPRPDDAPVGEWADVLRELPKRVGQWMERLQAEGIRGADLVFACIGPALEIFSRYSRVETAEGREVKLDEYLEKVWEVVGRTALESILGTEEARARNGVAGALEEDARLTALFLWTLQTSGGNHAGEAGVGEEEPAEEDEEEAVPKPKARGYSLVFDVVQRFAQPLGIDLPRWEGRIIETKRGVVRLLSVRERARQLFGEDGAKAIADGVAKDLPETVDQLVNLRLRGRGRRRRTPTGSGNVDPNREATTLDRVHAAMLLQAWGQANALRALIRDEQNRGPYFLRLANALSALYPRGSEEKRLLDAMLLAVPR